MPITLAVIFPGSQDCSQDFALVQGFVQKHGMSLKLYGPSPPQKNEKLSQTISPRFRLEALLEAVRDPEVSLIWAGRGGYGVSDLLSLVPWKELKKLPPKRIVGFSDISALHSAFYTRLGWQGIHGPMAFTPYWTQSSLQSKSLFLRGLKNLKESSSLAIKAIPGVVSGMQAKKIEGELFGGCLSVLTNLIGTPYLPPSLGGKILFFEDIGEPPARLFRYFNQWSQAGLLKGVKAIVWGRLTRLHEEEDESKKIERALIREIALRLSPLPIFSSKNFGHIRSQKSIPIGGRGHIYLKKGQHSLVF